MTTVDAPALHRTDRVRRLAVPGPVRWCGQVVAWLVILASLAALTAAVLVPRLAGATPYTILTGSMQPTMPPGTLVVDRPIGDEIGLGSVITYQLRSGQPTVVTHRVVEVSHDLTGAASYRTRGDANDVADERAVRPEQVRGEVWYAVPQLGRLNVLLTGHGHELLGYSVAAGLCCYALAMFGGAASRPSSSSPRRSERDVRAVRLRVLLVVAIALLVVDPAAAQGRDRIGVSRDGIHWSASSRAPLFDPAIRWVPGDRRTARFFVRNQAEDGGDLTVAVERTAADGLAGTGWLRISARAGSGPWLTVDDAGRHRLVRLADVPVGRVVPVQLRVAMGSGAPNDTMVLSTRLGLEVRLTESDATPVDPDHEGVLPNTGNAVRPWLPAAGLLLLAVGTILARRRAPSTPRPHVPETP